MLHAPNGQLGPAGLAEVAHAQEWFIWLNAGVDAIG